MSGRMVQIIYLCRYLPLNAGNVYMRVWPIHTNSSNMCGENDTQNLYFDNIIITSGRIIFK